MKEKEKENQLLKMMHSPKSITKQSNKNRRTAVVESNDLKSNILLKKNLIQSQNEEQKNSII